MENIPGYQWLRENARYAREQLGPLGNALLGAFNPARHFTDISAQLAILSDVKTIDQNPTEQSLNVAFYLEKIKGAVDLSQFFIKWGERFALFSSGLSLYATVISTPFTNLFSWRVLSIFTYFALTAWWIGVVVTPIFICIWRDLSVLNAQSIEMKRTLEKVDFQPNQPPQEMLPAQPTDWKKVLERVQLAAEQIEVMKTSVWILNLLPYPTHKPLCNLAGTLKNIETYLQEKLTSN